MFPSYIMKNSGALAEILTGFTLLVDKFLRSMHKPLVL